jgi:hypothetical protein
MIIQPIESISLLADNTFYQVVQKNQPAPAVPPGSPAGKKAGIGQEKKPQLTETARKLQERDKNLGQIERAVSSVKKDLIRMVRTLPPFPPGSQERVRILKGYIGLRKLIEALTIPPEVDPIKFREGIHLPELTEKASNQEVDEVLLDLEKPQKNLQEKRAALEAGPEKYLKVA